MSGHDSSPSERPPSSAPKQSSRSVEKTPRRAGLAPGDAFHLAQLFERVDANVRVRADAERNPAMLDPRRREEAIRKIGLGRGAGADGRSALREQVELGTVGMRRVHDGDMRSEAAGALEELDRPAAVLGEALLDLPGLLVRMDVQREAFGLREASDLLEPLPWAGADGVGGKADADAVGAQRLELGADTRSVTPGASAAARRGRTPRAGGRARARLRRPPPPPRAPPPDRGSGTRQRPCIRPNASPGRSRRRGSERLPASAARPPPASARATPRSRRRRRGHAANAGRCGCAR